MGLQLQLVLLLELLQLFADVSELAIAKELRSSSCDRLQFGVLPLSLVHLFLDRRKGSSSKSKEPTNMAFESGFRTGDFSSGDL